MDIVEDKLYALTGTEVTADEPMDTDQERDFFQSLLELTTVGNGFVSAPSFDSALRLLKTGM